MKHYDYDMGGCQNYGPFLGTLNMRCRIMIRIQKKNIIILTTTHMWGLAAIGGGYGAPGISKRPPCVVYKERLHSRNDPFGG